MTRLSSSAMCRDGVGRAVAREFGIRDANATLLA